MWPAQSHSQAPYSLGMRPKGWLTYKGGINAVQVIKYSVEFGGMRPSVCNNEPYIISQHHETDTHNQNTIITND